MSGPPGGPVGPTPYGSSPYGPSPYGPAPYGQGPQAWQPQQAQQPPAPWPGPHGSPPQGWRPPARPSFPHPEPREYHLMYRTWTYAWWRPVVGIVLLVLGMIVVLPLVLIPVLIVGVLVEGTHGDFATAVTNAANLDTPSPAGLLYINLTLAGLVLWAWMLIRVLHQMRPRWLSSVVPRLRWRFLLVCLGLALVSVAASFLVGVFLPSDVADSAGTDISTGRTVALVLVILLTTPLQSAGEEYAFRGYLLQALGSLLRNKWVTIVVTATLFATAHLQFAPPLFLDRFLFGLIAAWLVIRTGGLEAGIALHVLNNYLALGLAILGGDLGQTLNSPPATWWNLPVSLTQSIVFALLVTWVAGRMKLQTRTRPPEQSAQPAVAQPSAL